jgi:hypothetical protein
MLGLGDSQAPWAFERNDIAPGVVALVTSADGPHLRLTAERLRDDYLNLLAGQLGAAEIAGLESHHRKTRHLCLCRRPAPTGQPHAAAGLYLAGDFTAGDYPRHPRRRGAQRRRMRATPHCRE